MATNYAAFNSAVGGQQANVNLLAQLLGVFRQRNIDKANAPSIPSTDIYGDAGKPDILLTRPEAVHGMGMRTAMDQKGKSRVASEGPTLEELGLAKPGSPEAKVRAGTKVAATVMTGRQQSKPSAEATKEQGESAEILGGVQRLGPLARKVGANYKASQNPLKGAIADVGAGMAQAFPATAQQIDPDKAAYMTQAQSVLDAIGRSRSGAAIGPNEWLSFRQFIPMEQDFAAGDQAVRQKLNALVGAYKSKALAHAASITNPVARQQYEAQINANMSDVRAQLETAFLGGGETPGAAAPQGGHKTASGIEFQEEL